MEYLAGWVGAKIKSCISPQTFVGRESSNVLIGFLGTVALDDIPL